MNKKLFPNLYVIGSMKCGTTSLHDYLNNHPDIFMTFVKEPEFFLDDPAPIREGKYKSKDELLSSMFKGYKNQKIIGESSTSYTKIPFVPGCEEVPKRIKSVCRNPKFVYILRNPLGRITSEFKRAGYYYPSFKGSFDDFLKSRFIRYSLYTSQYFFQISNYLKYFNKNNFKIIIFEEFINNPKMILNEIFDFLGLDPNKYQLEQFKTHEKSSYSGSLKFNKEIYHKIIEPIKEDISKIEKFLGRSLDTWDLSEEKWCE